MRLAYVLIFKNPLVLPTSVDSFAFHHGANALAKVEADVNQIAGDAGELQRHSVQD